MKGKNTFKILTAPNFYFPVIDKGKKFIVLDTIEFELEIDKSRLKLQDFFSKHEILDFRLYAEPIWKEIQDFIKGKKEYKKCWFVPLRMYSLGDKIITTVDVLKAV